MKGNKHQFKCNSGNCVPIGYLLDGDADCDPAYKLDLSDEGKQIQWL